MQEYGLLGYPLGHSFSKSFFTDKFNNEGIDAQFLNFELPEAKEILSVIENHPKLKGFSITIPHKQNIIPLLDDMDEAAKNIGAVNSVKITRTGNKIHLKGFNTDTYGFENSLKPLLKGNHKKALLLGTGGASKAVAHVLSSLEIQFRFVSRNPGAKNQISYSDLKEEGIRNYPLIINTTPLGTYPKTKACPDIPYEQATENHLFYDLVYNPEITLFLSKAKKQGAVIKNGLEMLRLQAERSWKIWNE